MAPIMEADFDWVEDVQASVPVFKKGDYEITIKSVRASAWPKSDEHGNPTGEITRVIKLRPEMVGVYDSHGKLKSEQDKKLIKGLPCEEINLWIASEGGRRMSKKAMMAIAGYDPDDADQEKEFNNFLKSSKLDLKATVEDREDGDGYLLKIGEGYAKLLVGKSVRSHMEPETREIEGRDPIVQQNYKYFTPVNK